jgi:mRNA deadenylase 3'-5' endonuclease subunit Ccr4
VEIRYDAGAMMTSDDAVDCVGLIAVVEKDARQFIIATTHHFWDPRKLKLKHKQVEYLLFELDKMERKYPKIPVVVMGDFNFTPTGRDIDIPINFSPYDTMIGKFNSAYRFILGDEPEYTTLYKRGPRHLHSAKVPPRSAWAVDYIFYKNADVMGVLEIPNAEKITSENWRGIPNSQYGSDHLSLLADFKI